MSQNQINQNRTGGIMHYLTDPFYYEPDPNSYGECAGCKKFSYLKEYDGWPFCAECLGQLSRIKQKEEKESWQRKKSF